jgi:glycerophosphoryl diester phosphodiesterase
MVRQVRGYDYVSVKFFESPRPLVFAHRGGMALGPENTIAAFDAGLATGADGLELDVRLAADGVPVVYHDATLDRTTNAAGPVAERTSAELARVDAAYHYAVDGRFPLRGAGVGIPALAEVLRRYPDARVVIEMKDDVEQLGEAVTRVVRAADAVDRVCAAGFSARVVRAARLTEPSMATSACQSEARLALHRTWIGWPVRNVAYHGYQLPEWAGRLHVVTPRFVRYAHLSGLKVQVWTVDVEPDMRRLLDWGVDALISNRPDLAVCVRDKWCTEAAER